jgi:hypothetical protein
MTDREKGTFEKVGAGVGGITGRVADTGIDLMGSMIKTVANTVGGWWSDRTPDEALRTFSPREDSTCRQHFENTRSDKSYDAVRPLYQFGHLAGQNPDYQGRSFEEVESDLKNAWTGDQAQRYGDWESVRDYVSGGYSARNPS